jgi:NarL family two-component system response regulator LiaR
MAEMIRILVVDDQAIVRESLCTMLRTKPGLKIIGQAGSGEEAIVQARTLEPDVILMDLVMVGAAIEGVAAIRAIKAQNPAARILVLSGFSEDAQIIESVRAGALGYILKSSAPEELVTAIRQIHRGDAPLNPAVARALVQQFNAADSAPSPGVELTSRELQITKLVAKGLSNEEIGKQLNIVPRTVGTHISNILAKLGLDNRTQLALWALRSGLVSLFDADDHPPDPSA